jgi:hypothetical protein
VSEKKQDQKLVQWNLGDVPEDLRAKIMNELDRLNVTIADFGHKKIPLYVLGPFAISDWIKNQNSLIETAKQKREEWRVQELIDETVEKIKEMLEGYYIER